MHEFEVGEEYENRLGRYVVLEINDDGTILVQFENGKHKRYNAELQWRIFENILFEDLEEIVKPVNLSRSQHAVSAGTFSLWEDIVPFISKHLHMTDDWLSTYDFHVAFLDTDEGQKILKNVQRKRDMAGKPKNTNVKVAKNMVAFFHKSWTEGNEQLHQRFDRMEIEGIYFYRTREK